MPQPGETSPMSRGSRALAPASHGIAWLAAGAVVLALSVGLGVSLSRGTSSVSVDRGTELGTADASKAKYGGLPTWLPKAKVPVGQVLHASQAHPALSIQGEGISVNLGKASVLVTAAGPSVPEEGRTPVPKTSPCEFIVTFAHASGVIPIRAGVFKFIDEQGNVRHPRVTAMDGGAPPRAFVPGKPVSLTVYDVLPTGDGALTWSPRGGRPIASWDFDVEID
jgi:hypothetical protein